MISDSRAFGVTSITNRKGFGITASSGESVEKLLIRAGYDALEEEPGIITVDDEVMLHMKVGETINL